MFLYNVYLHIKFLCKIYEVKREIVRVRKLLCAHEKSLAKLLPKKRGSRPD